VLASLEQLSSSPEPERLGARLDELLDKIDGVSGTVEATQSLVETLEADTNIMPWTFIVVDKSTREKLSKIPGYGFLAKKEKKLFSTGNLSILFVCPVTRRIVPCGPDGKTNGYNLRLPRLSAKTLRVLCFVADALVSTALTSQGCPLKLPSISTLLTNIPDLSEDAKARIRASVERAARAAGLDADADSDEGFEAVFAAVNGEHQREAFVFRAVASAEGFSGALHDWIDGPRGCGLVKVQLRGGRSRWVSPEGKQRLQEQGRLAEAATAGGAGAGGENRL